MYSKMHAWKKQKVNARTWNCEVKVLVKAFALTLQKIISWRIYLILLLLIGTKITKKLTFFHVQVKKTINGDIDYCVLGAVFSRAWPIQYSSLALIINTSMILARVFIFPNTGDGGRESSENKLHPTLTYTHTSYLQSVSIMFKTHSPARTVAQYVPTKWCLKSPRKE